MCHVQVQSLTCKDELYSQRIDRCKQNNDHVNEFVRHHEDIEEHHRHDIDKHEHNL
jgi:hypothetical protein